MEPFGLMTLFELFIAVYLLYSAVKGDGKLYENEYLNCSREEYVKGMRILALITGLLMLASSGLELLNVVDPVSALGIILWVLTFICIVLMMVYSSKKTDRAAAKADRPTAQSHPEKPHDPLRAAFVFDDEEDEEQAQGE